MPKGWVGSGSDNARGRPGLNHVVQSQWEMLKFVKKKQYLS